MTAVDSEMTVVSTRLRAEWIPGRNPLTLGRITSHVCTTLGVEFDELAGSGRRPMVKMARAVISRTARRHTTESFPDIARGLGMVSDNGRPKHTTVVMAHQRIESQIASGATVNLGGEELTVGELCERIERGLTGGGK